MKRRLNVGDKSQLEHMLAVPAVYRDGGAGDEGGRGADEKDRRGRKLFGFTDALEGVGLSPPGFDLGPGLPRPGVDLLD